MASERAAKKPATKKRTTTKKPTTKKSAAKPKARASTAGRAAAGNRLRVRQIRSGIGSPRKFRRTLTALGLKHHQDEVVVPDNPSIRGMLEQVGHLLEVKGEDA